MDSITFVGILDLLSRVISGFFVIGASAYVLFKNPINEYIKGKISHSFNENLEEKKHQLQTQLEQYKSLLMHDMEKIKADIDIKRSMSLKFAEIKFESLNELTQNLRTYTMVVTSWPRHSSAQKLMQWDELRKSHEKANESVNASSIFFDLDFAVEMSTLLGLCTDIPIKYPINSESNLAQEDEEIIVNIHYKHASVANRIRGEIYSAAHQNGIVGANNGS